MTAALVPIHPEAVPEDPQVLRWVIPPAVLAVVGEPAGLPDPLAALVADGTVAGVAVEPTAVLVRLAAGRSWRTEGTRVRTALQAALAAPGEWCPATAQTPDEVLRFAVDQVLDGEVGDYIRSHGGQVSLRGIDDGVVRLAMSGACAHCPASGSTLTDRIETALRARCPWLERIEAESESAGPLRRFLLPLTPVRSR